MKPSCLIAAAFLPLAFLFGHTPAGEPQAGRDSLRCGMAFVSDTQSPIWIESLFLGSDRNEEATDSIFADLARRKPSHLFMLGDLVSFGPYGGAWRQMDRHITSLRGAGITVHGVLGNHELMLFERTGEENFQERFPDHVRTGYVQTVDSVAVVLLNSNFETLGPADATRQHVWYRKTLDSLQNDPAIQHIVVCCHHSPFSNSRVVGGSEEVRKEFLPPFLGTSKCRLFLSGHAHAFEHFQEGGKTFLVIGGGGGPSQPLAEGKEQTWTDLAPLQKPHYHYLELRREKGRLIATLRGLSNDFSGFSDLYRVTIDGEPLFPSGR